MIINYTTGGLKHAKNKHNVSKKRIERALASKIYSVVKDGVNDSIIIFTDDIAVVVDNYKCLKSAFPYSKRYYRSKTKDSKNLLSIK